MSKKDQQRSNSRQHVIPCPLKRHFCGFTLIELLAAVLIIGILAAIAWPAYNKAVVNAKAAQLITAMRAVIKGENAYFVTHGEYALDIAELTINFNLPRKNVRHLSGCVTLGYGPAYGPNMWAIYTHSAPKMPIRGTRVRLVVILTAAQVILRWNVQRGGVFPNRSRRNALSKTLIFGILLCPRRICKKLRQRIQVKARLSTILQHRRPSG